MAIDITERKRLEEQFLQSQKMEAIGRLAGGVAHDFNNLLTVILASSAFALQHLAPADTARADLAQVQEAAQRAAAVTRQLLTFSRKEPSEAKDVDLTALIRGFSKLLVRVVREDVALALDLPDRAIWVVASPNQLEQVLLNLVVNACDAMPSGGAVTIGLVEVPFEPDLGSAANGGAGRRGAQVVVRDTGVGMDAETLRRSFEPFFTTKPVGQGTGLGLATAYGIVREAGGRMWAESQPGKGSTFHWVLPVRESGALAATAPATAPAASGQETILVVEDDPLVRMVTVRMLRNLGYRVIEAGLGEDAVALATADPGRIHLLLTDVVMPDLSGPEVAKRVAALRPEVAVLFVSGYPDHPALEVNAEDIQRSFLPKPFTAESLGRRVRALLHGETEPA
ncbi:MAG: response regulator [Deltaproteobacteria bacterium]|nr:response regulator [Deltaproteobacteria bacterium]